MSYDYKFGGGLSKRKLKKSFDVGYFNALSDVLESSVKFASIFNFASIKDKDLLLDDSENYRESLGEVKKVFLAVTEEMKVKEKRGAVTDEDKDKYYNAKKEVDDTTAKMEQIDEAKKTRDTNLAKISETNAHVKFLVEHYDEMRSRLLKPELYNSDDSNTR